MVGGAFPHRRRPPPPTQKVGMMKRATPTHHQPGLVWVTGEEIASECGGGPFTASDMSHIEQCACAAHEYVCSVRPDVPVASSSAIRLGAIKLGASLWRRRGATGGDFAEFNDMTTVIMPGIIDAEVQALLGIGRHHGPVVA